MSGGGIGICALLDENADDGIGQFWIWTQDPKISEADSLVQ
jgi:hypothetical protein